MSITLIDDGNCCYMTFAGSITYEFWHGLEDIIIGAMRRHTYFQVDLSGIQEIDLCGLHLIGILHSVGGKNVSVVASSPVVDIAAKRLLASQRSASLGLAMRREEVLKKHYGDAQVIGTDAA